jgi:biopolymer transport protein ExbB/TolQ
MDFFDNLDRMVQIGMAVAVVCIVLYVVIGRIWFWKGRRVYWSASSVGNALQQLQAIARPSIQYEIEEKLREREEDDDQGGPDDPGTYYRRLRERIDQQDRNGGGTVADGEAGSKELGG